MTANSLWTCVELLAATQGTLSDDAHQGFGVQGISIDTRTLQPGDLFIALVGPNFDGHTYVAQAFDRGAAAALISRPCPDAAGPCVRVEDTQQALTQLGKAARARFAGPLIAITGSVGKTTTRALTAAAHGSFAKVHATTGNLNNHLGVPLTLARMPRDAEVGVLEMGMNHFTEIEHLSQIARPTHALITAIDWVHSENLDGTLDGVAKAKAEICAGLSGPLVAPLALKHLLTPHISAAQAVQWITEPFSGEIALPGAANRWNAALALSAVPAKHQAAAQGALALLTPQEGRGAAIHLTIAGTPICVYDDAYNAAPASMRLAVESLVNQPTGRKIAVVGDMAELANPLELHESLGKFLAEQPLDMVIAVGKFKSSILAPLPPSILAVGFADPEPVAAFLVADLQDRDQILVKASNSTGLNKIVADLRAAQLR